MRLDASELRLTVSPDVLELGGALASSVLAPLMQVGCCRGRQPPSLCPVSPKKGQSPSLQRYPSCAQAFTRPMHRSTLSHSAPTSPPCSSQPKPDAPLASCTQFEHVWSFNPSELFAGQQGGRLAVSLAVTGAEGGLTVWRAKAPTGYAVAGSIVTPGVSQVGAGPAGTAVRKLLERCSKVETVSCVGVPPAAS